VCTYNKLELILHRSELCYSLRFFALERDKNVLRSWEISSAPTQTAAPVQQLEKIPGHRAYLSPVAKPRRLELAIVSPRAAAITKNTLRTNRYAAVVFCRNRIAP
jgi:hypothetical protein